MPKIIDHDQRRRDIVEVAKSIILKGGFEAATMRSIAAEAGFANGALKHYFPGKESIVAATFETILQQMSEAVQEHHGRFGGEGHDGPSSRDRPLILSAAARGTGRCSSRSRRCGRRPGT